MVRVVGNNSIDATDGSLALPVGIPWLIQRVSSL